jgi:hypothetical protein
MAPPWVSLAPNEPIMVDLVELLDIRQLKRKNKKDYEAHKWNERLMMSASCRAFGFSSRCVDNKEEDWAG